jgi:lipopolysaccharide biosynthesis regulator YciM
MATGRFDFREWSMNELARSLPERDRTDAAIAMLELNAEYYPKSVAIDLLLGSLYRTRGEREKAVARYRMALKKDPGDDTAQRALKELEYKHSPHAREADCSSQSSLPGRGSRSSLRLGIR